MRKFIVVVPSVAIREGVLKILQLTERHFRDTLGVDYAIATNANDDLR